MSKRLLRVAVATTAGAASLLFVAAPAEAGLVACAVGAVDTGNLTVHAGATVNCTFDTVGDCLYYYDPLFNFPTQIAGETTQYVFCHV